MLIMMASVAVAAGLAASMPARAATSAPSSTLSSMARQTASAFGAAAVTPPGGDLTLTFDPGTSYDPVLMQQWITGFQAKNAHLSDTIKREIEEYEIPGFTGDVPAGWQQFDGAISMTPDDGGLSVTIPAAEVQTATNWWQTIVVGLAGILMTGLVTVACSALIPVAVIGCSAFGAFIGAFFGGVLVQYFENTLTDALSWVATLVVAVGAAIGAGAVAAALKKFAALELPGLIKKFAVWIGGGLLKALSWLGSGFVAIMTGLASFIGDLASGFAAAIVDAPPPAIPSGQSCDIYNYYGTPCVAAYSTVRALSSSYGGALYQVRRASDGATANIGPLSPGGHADASQQDRFCDQTTCIITKVYDQSPGTGWNDLIPGPGGSAVPTQDMPADAGALPVKVGSDKAYGIDFPGRVGYRDNHASNIATGSEPEGMYMVASGTHVNGQCCFDFGNAEVSETDTGGGHMDAVNLGMHCHTGTCSGVGPWVQADLENGLFQGGGSDPTNLSNTGNSSDFVTAMLKNNGTDTFALKGGDSRGGGLSTWYDGPLPGPVGADKWAPMSKEGAITLGVGGDNSNWGEGSFFEGAMTDGYPSDAADAAVQASIVAAGYSGNSGGNPVTSQVAGPAVVHSAGATGAGASGFTSVYSVDAKNGHLQESYLPYMGASWVTQDLSATGGALPGTPPVKPDTRPVAVVRCGYTGVFTVDAADNHLQETYLPAIGQSWVTQDLTGKYGTPPTKVTPTAVVHFAGATGASAACGFSSVYSIDAANGHLDETYLTLTGQPWVTQDLSAAGNAGTPASQPGTSPVALVHDGYTSVFTVGADHHIYETHLKAIGDKWGLGDLTSLAAGPLTTTTLTAVFHDGYTSVYAVGDPLRHLFELALPAIGASWAIQDLTAGGPRTPAVAPGTAPVALFHTGYTSVYTVDAQTMHVQETYLSNIGNTWATQDFSQYGTPPTTETPMVVVHPDEGGALTRTSVFTINQFDNDLQDTALAAIGDKWTTQDLHATDATPPVMVDDSPTAGWSVAHDGYTSVFAADPGTGDLTESYLSGQGASWQAQDLTAGGPRTPTVMQGTMPVTVAWDGHVAAFTIGPKGDLWETYLPAIGGTWTSQDLTAATNSGQQTAVTPTAVFHGGNVNVFTVDDGGHNFNAGDLREYTLPAGSSSWETQDLSDAAVAGTPQVAPQTSPVALYHDGYTSVYTADNNPNDSGNDLQTTFLTAIGNPWQTQDLTTLSGGKPMASFSTPAALYHSGYTSVYSVDAGNGHIVNGHIDDDLRTTFLTAIGDDWQTQDLTTDYQAPQVPVVFLNADGLSVDLQSHVTALYHSGYASVYTLDFSDNVHATFLPAIGDSWQTQVLPAPAADYLLPPSPLVHDDANGGLTWTSLFTIDAPNGGLQDSYLPKIGDSWSTQELPQ